MTAHVVDEWFSYETFEEYCDDGNTSYYGCKLKKDVGQFIAGTYFKEIRLMYSTSTVLLITDLVQYIGKLAITLSAETPTGILKCDTPLVSKDSSIAEQIRTQG